LGVAASGKSTFIKQMRIAYACAWTPIDMTNFREMVFNNIWDGLRLMSVYITENNLPVVSSSKAVRYLAQSDHTTTQIDSEAVQMMKEFWAEFQSVDVPIYLLGNINVAYFMKEIDKIATPDYVPTEDHILNARQRTTGVSETAFVVDKVKITLYDMGGQQNERGKWHNLVTNKLKGFFYFVAVDEFNTPSVEPGHLDNETKLELSLRVWKDILEEFQDVLKNISVFVIFNKIDLLEEKLKNFSAFTDQFPNYGGPKSREGAIAYIEKIYRKAMEGYFVDTQQYSFYPCCALDGTLMKKVFEECKLHIVSRRLEFAGL